MASTPTAEILPANSEAVLSRARCCNWRRVCPQVTDQMLVATPFLLQEQPLCLVFGLIYPCFNLGWYYLAPASVRLIYDFVDWNHKPEEAILFFLLVNFMLMPAFSFVHYGIFRHDGLPLSLALA